MQVLEALRAAGIRPTVYANASLPEFAWPLNTRALSRLDPFDFYTLETSEGRGLPVAYRCSQFGLWCFFAARHLSYCMVGNVRQPISQARRLIGFFVQVH